ncbi:MAG: AAC(3)-I family aminoglycoside N-acetyltransferase [Thermosynechococcaceae cyanobacterium]
MPPFSISHLSAKEIEVMRALLKLFGDAFDEAETYCSAPPQTDYLQRLLKQEHCIALAALKQTEVVGGLVAYELQKFEQARSEIYIYDLAVAIAHRRQGIATALIQTLQEIALERGAYVIFVQADLEDEPAISLYTQLGDREDVLHFDIPVQPSNG